jgi:hypothetical protein
MSFRMDSRLNGRRETIYLGKYGPDGVSLARAREKCIDARRNIAARYSHCPKDLCRKLAVLLPSRYDADAPMSRATFNRVTYLGRGLCACFLPANMYMASTRTTSSFNPSYQTAGAATRPDFVERPITAPVQSFNTRGTCVRRGSRCADRRRAATGQVRLLTLAPELAIAADRTGRRLTA